MSLRDRALGWGLVILVVYVAGALLSGHLSPLARRPLLDGFIPPVPYRWVDPPPELAPSNLPPTPGTAQVSLGPQGSEAAFIATGDAQVTLSIPEHVFPDRPGATAVEITIEPVTPPSAGPLPGQLSVTGNVYVIRATYRPTGVGVRSLAASFVAILVYPALATDLGNHTLVVSPDGERWMRIDTHDQHATKQVNGRIHALGYVAVASPPLPSLPPDGAPQGDGRPIPLAIVAVLIGVALLLGGVLLVVRGSGRGAPR